MDASNRTPTTKQLPVAPGVDEKRRRRSVQERRKIFEETLAPEASVARVARAHGVNVNQVFSWRLYRRGRLGGAIAAAAVRPSERTGGAALVPVTLSDAPVERAPVRARSLYAGEAFGVELDHTIYAPDSTTIDLCLSLCPWAPFQNGRGAVKLHTLLDLRGPIPSFIRITNGRLFDVSTLDHLLYEPGAFYVLDCAYLDFRRLHQAGSLSLAAPQRASQPAMA